MDWEGGGSKRCGQNGQITIIHFHQQYSARIAYTF
jgi:hypothetical protein